jgi:hypothetical protein
MSRYGFGKEVDSKDRIVDRQQTIEGSMICFRTDLYNLRLRLCLYELVYRESIV